MTKKKQKQSKTKKLKLKIPGIKKAYEESALKMSVDTVISKASFKKFFSVAGLDALFYLLVTLFTFIYINIVSNNYGVLAKIKELSYAAAGASLTDNMTETMFGSFSVDEMLRAISSLRNTLILTVLGIIIAFLILKPIIWRMSIKLLNKEKTPIWQMIKESFDMKHTLKYLALILSVTAINVAGFIILFRIINPEYLEVFAIITIPFHLLFLAAGKTSISKDGQYLKALKRSYSISKHILKLILFAILIAVVFALLMLVVSIINLLFSIGGVQLLGFTATIINFVLLVAYLSWVRIYFMAAREKIK